MGKLLEDLYKGSGVVTAWKATKISDQLSAQNKKSDELREALNYNQAQQNGYSERLQKAIEEGNHTAVQQLQAQRKQLMVESQMLESQLRTENAAAQERQSNENEDSTFNTLWEVVEKTKESVRDHDFYPALLYAVNARSAYTEVASQLRKSDNKMQVSKLNEEVCDIIDKILVDENASAIQNEASQLLSDAKQMESTIPFVEMEESLTAKEQELKSVTYSDNLTEISRKIDSLKQSKEELDTIENQAEKGKEVYEKFGYVLSPFIHNFLDDFLKTHRDFMDKIKEEAEKQNGFSMDSATSNELRINEIFNRITSLKSNFDAQILALGRHSEVIKANYLRLRMKKINITFALVLIGGFILTVLIASTTEYKLYPFYLIGMVIYWIVIRSKKNKLMSELGMV